MSCKCKDIGNLVEMQKESWHQLETYVLKVDSSITRVLLVVLLAVLLESLIEVIFHPSKAI